MALLCGLAAVSLAPPQPERSAQASATVQAATFAVKATAYAARPVTATVVHRATVAALAGDGPILASAPFFSWRRPFDNGLEILPSRYYPYGTTANGQYLLHHGVDIGNPMGSPVLAVADGTVIYAGSDERVRWGPETSFYGRLVVIEHPRALAGRSLYTLYGHVSRELVAQGRAVRAGQPIAEVGMEGVALGPHLHLEVRLAARNYHSSMNPELFLAHLPGHGAIIGRLGANAGTPAAAPAPVAVSLHSDDAAGHTDWLAQTTTYPTTSLSCQTWGESFVFGDLPAGRYRLFGDHDRAPTGVPVTVTADSAVVVTLDGPW